MKNRNEKKSSVKFIFPIDGDCLNSADGILTEKGLTFTASVEATPDADVYVNGIPAFFDGECFKAEITINTYRMSLICEDRKNGDYSCVTVFAFFAAENKFRVSSDDNIRFLKNLTDNAGIYKSLFDDPYLATYKRVHDETGACVCLNLFYGSGDGSLWENEAPFDLSMMTDAYKTEWERNSNWLRLSFHSAREYPICPYENATYERAYAEAKAVNDEIVRFAGIKSLSKTATVHYGAVSQSAMCAIRNLGYENFAGYFDFDNEGRPLVSYGYPAELVAHIGSRDFWRDTDIDVTFSRIDRVMNYAKTAEENIARLDEVLAVPGRAKFVELMIHEQYFYKKYDGYIEKFGEIVLGCCKHLRELGYTSAFTEDAIRPCFRFANKFKK